MLTYGIACGVLLLRADNGAAAHGLVQGALALDNGLAGATASSADLAANLGDGFPVLRHVGGWCCRVVTCCVGGLLAGL